MAADFVWEFNLMSPAAQDQIRNEICAYSNMATAENILSLFKLLDSDSQHHVAKTLPYLYPREARKQLTLLKTHTERAIKIVKYGRKYIVSDKKRAEKRVKREAKKKEKKESESQQPVAGAAVSTVTEQIDWGQCAAAVPARHEYEEDDEDSDVSGATDACRQRFAFFTSRSASERLVTGAPATGRGVEELIPGMLTDMTDPDFPDDPEPLAKLYPYVNEYREMTHERQGIAVDVKFVHMHGEPHVPRAAIVSAVDQDGRVVMNMQDQKIKVLEKEHDIGKVVINKWTKKANGITGLELIHGISPQELKRKLQSAFGEEGNKYWITHGHDDMVSCGFSYNETCGQVVDTTTLFRERVMNEHGVMVTRPCSLKNLVKFFYEKDIQQEGKPHSSYEDAYWTAKLFNDQFLDDLDGYRRVRPGIVPLIQAKQRKLPAQTSCK